MRSLNNPRFKARLYFSLYVLLILLPGGSVIALLVWLFRHYQKKREVAPRVAENGPASPAHAHPGAARLRTARYEFINFTS
jgi:hypothetical protein